MLKMESALVTGSDGFIGSHLVRRLKGEGVRIYCIDKNTGTDISKSGFLKVFNKKIDIVFHLAMISRAGSFGYDQHLIYTNNIKGMLNILELSRRAGAKLVLTSSYIYGKPDYMPIDEDHPVRPHNAYACSKWASEILCKAYHENFGLKVVVLRPFNIYGPGQNGDFVIPEILGQLKKSGNIILKGRNERRDFLYVDDMVDACVKAALYEKKGFDVFNIGTGESFSINEVVRNAARCMGKKNVRVRYLNVKKGTVIRDAVADVRKARRLLGWSPVILFEDGIRQTVQTS